MSKSPILMFEDFVSPLLCEEIVDSCLVEAPDTDENNQPIMNMRFNRLAELRLSEAIAEVLIPELESYYDFEYKGMHPFEIEYYPQGCKNNKQRCENSVFVATKGKKSWHRTSSKDFCAVLFLKDYRDKKPLDPYYEVMGGKLQFLNHNFSIKPKRGTLVVFPGEEHFINCTSDITYGDLHQVRFYIAATKPYIYDRHKFPGDYTTWFK